MKATVVLVSLATDIFPTQEPSMNPIIMVMTTVGTMKLVVVALEEGMLVTLHIMGQVEEAKVSTVSFMYV